MPIILKRLLFFSAWGLMIFIPKKSRIRFTPISNLTILMITVFVFIGKSYNFWSVKGGRKTFTWNAFSIIYGFFPIGNYIVCHLFFGKFKLYLLANFILNCSYAFFGIPLLEKWDFVKYEKFNKYHHIALTMTCAIFGYVYQSFLEKYGFMKIKKLVK
jgi:hypothetical protein